MGIVSSIGLGADGFWKSTLEGRSGISEVTSFDTSMLASHIAGAVKGFRPEEYIPDRVMKRVDPFVHFALASAKMAIDDSGLDLAAEDTSRIGVIIGSGLGGILFHESQIERVLRIGLQKVNPLGVPRITPNSVSSQIAIAFGIRGPNMVISNACASGTNAIGEAFRKIQSGEIDAAIAGGSEAAVSSFTLAAYDAMGVLSRRNGEPEAASRPFDRERDGFVLGEGAAVLMLEGLDRALARGARVHAELKGYSSNSGAYHMVIPLPEGTDIADVMSLAIKDAGLRADDIGYINAHGTSTIQNDRTETRAIKKVFGDRAYRIPVSSIKSMIGHTIGASGAIGACACCLALREQTVPATANYRARDPECDLDYVAEGPRRARFDNVLLNSFGFGSNNACLVIRRYDG